MKQIFKGQKSEIRVRLTAKLDADFGEKVEVPFVAVFRKLSRSESRTYGDKAQKGEMSDEECVKATLVRWEDMPGFEEGTEVEFNAENLDAALDVDGYCEALVAGFLKVQYGRGDLVKGN